MSLPTSIADYNRMQSVKKFMKPPIMLRICIEMAAFFNQRTALIHGESFSTVLY